MAGSRRAASLALVFVAVALTVTGVVIAATDSNPSSNGENQLTLHGYPPKSAQLHVVISTGQQYNVTADLAINFVTNSVDANVHVPLFFSSALIEARLVSHHLYIGSSNLSSILGASWISTSAPAPSLYGLALEMTKPDISLISGFTSLVISKSGSSMTYAFHRNNASVSAPMGLPIVLPTHAAVDFSLTVGSEGQLIASGFTVTSARSTVSITATVVSYNKPAHIVAPATKDVKVISISALSRLFGSSLGSSLLSPHGISSLGQIRVN